MSTHWRIVTGRSCLLVIGGDLGRRRSGWLSPADRPPPIDPSTRKHGSCRAKGLAFEVTYAAALRSEPIKGRVYVFLEPDGSGAEPRSGPNWFRPQPFFAVDVDELEAR